EEQVAVVAEHGQDGDLHAVAPVLNQEIPHAVACLRPMPPGVQDFRGLAGEFHGCRLPSSGGSSGLAGARVRKARRWSKASSRLSSAIAAGKFSGSRPVSASLPGSSKSAVTDTVCQTPPGWAKASLAGSPARGRGGRLKAVCSMLTEGA